MIAEPTGWAALIRYVNEDKNLGKERKLTMGRGMGQRHVRQRVTLLLKGLPPRIDRFPSVSFLHRRS
jgi:hypothetical protein